MNAPSFLARSVSRYTAAQIACAAHVSRQAALASLKGIASDGTVIVRGNEAQVWSLDSLPTNLTEKIKTVAEKNAMRIEIYLAAFLTEWQPAMPLSEISDECQDKAKKLRAALLPALQRMDSPMFENAERISLGLRDYQNAFGHVISERQWERLINRTMLRAGVDKKFERLEIYLSANPDCNAAAKRLLPAEMGFARLTQAIQGFSNPNAPTRTEMAAFWAETFELYKDGADTKRELRSLRRKLVSFLFRHSPWLAQSQRAMRVAFDRKFARWIENNESSAALRDGRELKRGERRAPEIPKTDIDRIIWHATRNCGGRIAQAKRELVASGQRSDLSDETIKVLARHASSKSHVNRRLMNQISTEVKNLTPHSLGKKAKDDAMAHVDRDYSKLASMEVINADDFTFPVYFYVPDGNGWFTLTRGQCLLMLDVRCWKIIAWALLPDRNYNSLAIRTLMNRICTGWGIPGAWYFERGIWQNSHVVKGSVPPGWNIAHSSLEAKIGWESLGVKFIHAIRARTKPVERVGGMLQNLMHGVRGYCGRDERSDCPEVTKRALDDVKFHRVQHPGELFLSFDEWHNQLGQLIDRYNAESQDGKVLQSLSPDEAFEKFWPHDNPPARFDKNSWHLVAHYVRPAPVTTNGICFRIGTKSYVYRNERTGQDRGKTVLAWFDPDCPEFLAVTDLNKKNPYLVERAMPVDFLAASGDPHLARELAKAASHSAYPRARFNTLKARFEPTFRRNLVDVDTAATAQEMNRLRAEKAVEQKETARARKSFIRLGMAEPRKLRPDKTESLNRLVESLKDDESIKNEEAT